MSGLVATTAGAERHWEKFHDNCFSLCIGDFGMEFRSITVGSLGRMRVTRN